MSVFPHVSGIAGQASVGAQSVVLSGGYLDYEDHGEWFLYTGRSRIQYPSFILCLILHISSILLFFYFIFQISCIVVHGSGGRDLSGNKRTNKDQSFDQTFENYNKALQVSCQKGYPVRVVR